MFKDYVSKEAMLLLILMALFLLSIPISAQINNCCSVDRQCASDEEWVQGYYAFRNSDCGVDSQQQPAHQTRQDQTPSQSNNCCFSGWQCSTDDEWTQGYWAFRRDQCDSQAQAQGQHLGEPRRQNDDQQSRRQNDDQQSRRQNDDQQHHSNQGTDANEKYYKSQHCTTLEDGTPACYVRLKSWDAFWRAVCRTYPSEIWDIPECR